MTERMTAKQYNKAKRKRPVDRESPIQISIVNWLRSVMPDAIIHHCRNEIKRGGQTYANEQIKARNMGAVKGFPDLAVLPYASVGALFFEVKAEGAYARKEQKEVHEHIRSLGYRVAVVRSVQDVRECLQEWGVGYVENIELRGVVS